MTSVPSAFRIQDMTQRAQETVRSFDLDTGANDIPDGVIDSQDAGRVAAALAQPGLDGSTRAMLGAVQQTIDNPLAVPRTTQTATKIGDSIQPGNGILYDAIKKLSRDNLKGATVEERTAMLKHILNGTGYTGFFAFWAKRVNNPKERLCLDILHSTPKHQQPYMMAELVDQGLHDLMTKKVHGKEYQEYKQYLFSHAWMLDDVRQIVELLSKNTSYNLASLRFTLGKLQERKGDAFVEEVMQGLYMNGTFERLMPFVYWSPVAPSCNDIADVAYVAAWKMQMEMTVQQHRQELESFLQGLPDGPTAAALWTEFDKRHDMQRILSLLSVAGCLLDALTNDTTDDY